MTDFPDVRVQSLDTFVPVGDNEATPPVPESSYEPHAVRRSLEAPYNVTEWRADLSAMATGAPTGFDLLDDVGMQWLPGKLTAVLARPAGGKTAFLLEAACRYLEHPDHQDAHALFLSWEEPLADVVTRLMMRAHARQHHTGHAFSGEQIFTESWRKYARGELVNEAYRPEMAATAESVRQLLTRLHLIDGDDLGRNVRGVLAGAAEWMREADSPRIGLVCVDYFQKLRSAVPSTHRLSELQDVADTLRRFAKGASLRGEAGDRADTIDPIYAVPVLVGAQVNRYAAVSNQDGTGHPTGDQIREGDDLLNDAANVLALSWEKSGDSDRDPVRWLRVSVPKHRGGRSRGVSGEEVARLQWHPARAWFADHAKRLEVLGVSGGVEWSAPKSNGSEGEKLKTKKASGEPPIRADYFV